MSKKFSTLLLWSVAVALVAFAALVGFFTGGTVPSTPLPNPNGYDDFLKAGALVVGDAGNAWAFEKDQLGKFVSDNAETFQVLRLGLTRKCSVPTDSAITNSPVKDLVKLRRVSQLLEAEERLAELEDRARDASRTCLDIIRFGNEISRGGVMIDRMIGVACESLGGSRLVPVALKLDCEQLKPVVGELEQMDSGAVRWDEIRKNEKKFEWYRLRKMHNPIRWIIDTWQAQSVIKRAKERHDLLVARLRLLIVDLALRCYQAEHGRGPGQLEQLVPTHLKRVPMDPFSGRSLIYRPSGTNWLLYSVGLDGMDHGGRAGHPLFGTGDLFLDSKW